MIEGEIYQPTKNGDVLRSRRTSTSTSSAARRRFCSAASAQIGGMLGKLGDATRSSARCGEYGFHLGVAFQLVDDLLDFTGDDARRLGSRSAGTCGRAS